MTDSDLNDLLARVENGEPVGIAVRDFDRLQKEFRLVKTVDTCMKGDIHLLERGNTFYVAEHPETDTVVMRSMGSEADGARFIERRLETYERMWDGCGCKIDYYKSTTTG
jgi:hypothetical protein